MARRHKGSTAKRLGGVALVLVVAALIVVVRLVEDIGPEGSPDSRWTVVRILDGDTVELLGGDRLRLLAIDTPERGEPLHDEATALLGRLVLGQETRVEFAGRRRDSYGRLLGYLWVDTLLINKVMIDSGMACLYLFADTDLDAPEVVRMLTAQQSALHRSAGLWSLPYTPESYYITSNRSFRFHRPGCRSVADLDPSKARRFETREEALAAGLSPCRNCKP